MRHKVDTTPRANKPDLTSRYRTVLESLEALREEMTDRFGRFPKPVQRLFAIAEARIHTAALRALELEVRDQKVMLRRRDGSFLQPDGRFPRMKATAPDALLRELNRLLIRWPGHTD